MEISRIRHVEQTKNWRYNLFGDRDLRNQNKVKRLKKGVTAHASLPIDNILFAFLFFLLFCSPAISHSASLSRSLSLSLHTFRNCKLCKSQWTAFNYKSTQLCAGCQQKNTLRKYLQNAAKLNFPLDRRPKQLKGKCAEGKYCLEKPHAQSIKILYIFVQPSHSSIVHVLFLHKSYINLHCFVSNFA